MSADLEWLDEDETEAGPLIANALDHKEKAEFPFHWQLRARREQCAPVGDWRIWMIMAGRGFGKTRAGAEWVRQIAEADPSARIALVAASLGEARAVMVEGQSGLLAVCPPERMPHFEPSLHRVRFANGAQVQLFSAAEPEGLRGPQHSHARRSGPKGVFRQSGPLPARRLAPAHYCGLTARPTPKRERSRLLPGHRPRSRHLGRTRRRACDTDRRGGGTLSCRAKACRYST